MSETDWTHIWANTLYRRLTGPNGRYAKRLYELLEAVADGYPDDPGTSDLYDEQPIRPKLNLGHLRLAKELIRYGK